MKRTTIEYIAEGTGGKLAAVASNGAYRTVSSVSIDSRVIPEDCLFFCIIGERTDAHRFLPDVREKGCHNVVVSDPVWAAKMAAARDMNVVLVDDTRLALMALGERYLDDWKGLTKVGVTGSVGKTSTKEFLYSVLKSRYRTGKTPGNLNSEFGVPLTAFQFDEAIEAAVIEMGAGHGSPIADLAKIAKPDHAVITNVGTSHLEVFGSRKELLREKLRIATGFTKDNALVINTDSDLLTRESVLKYQPGDARIITVGTGGDEDYILYNICDNGIDGVKCMIAHNGRKAELVLPTVGAHNLGNAAEAIAIGEVMGIPMEDSVRVLAEPSESNANRLDVIRCGSYTVINDTYNASPESMKAGINVMMHSPAKRRIAVLGSMYELGDDSEQLHRSVGEYAAGQQMDLLITVGDNAVAIAEGARDAGFDAVKHFSDRDEAAGEIRKILKDGDLIFVKASRSMELEKLVQAITEAK